MTDSWASHTALCTGQYLVDKFTSSRWAKYTAHVTKLRTQTKFQTTRMEESISETGFGTEDNIIRSLVFSLRGRFGRNQSPVM